jgi:anti-sigma-K factor RskA
VILQEYIASGVIESVVMGLASESERAEFEQLCTQYPELVAARRDFEERLEEYASEHAVLPPPEVKVKVLEAIGNTPSRQIPSSNPPEVITMENEKKPVRAEGWLRFIAAASVILLIAMGWLYYQTSSQNKDLTSTNDRLKEKLNSTDSVLNKIVRETEMIKDPNTTVINMVGTQAAPRSSANIYWDSTSSNVFLVVKNMPKLPSDQQYQLWALLDGKPSDLGIFDASEDKVILKMKNIQKAQAFAITIEKKGGAPSPTLQKMQSMGKTLQSQ